MPKTNQTQTRHSRPIKYLGVFIFLTLLYANASAGAFTCNELFLNKDLPSAQTVRSTTKDKEVPLYPYLTRGNADQLFVHNYDWRNPTAFGVKAVVTKLLGEAAQVYFFPTGKGRKSWSIHHVDAISVALNDPHNQLYYLKLPYIQGYEMTAKQINGRWVIVRLDIRSTLTYLHESQPSRRPSREQEEDMLNALISRIDEDLQQFRRPSIDDQYDDE